MLLELRVSENSSMRGFELGEGWPSTPRLYECRNGGVEFTGCIAVYNNKVMLFVVQTNTFPPATPLNIIGQVTREDKDSGSSWSSTERRCSVDTQGVGVDVELA
ncbi:hypothetical protein LINPERHAP1_LOCUS8410 [Linum perenne]